MNSFIGLNFNNTVKERGEIKKNAAGVERALFPVTCEMRSLETPIHLPNFGQLNKL